MRLKELRRNNKRDKDCNNNRDSACCNCKEIRISISSYLVAIDYVDALITLDNALIVRLGSIVLDATILVTLIR